MLFTVYKVKSAKTHKSFGVEEVVDNALRDNIDTICLISSGNYVQAVYDELSGRNLQRDIRLINLSSNPSSNKPWEEVEIEGRRILRNARERACYVRDKVKGAERIRDYTDFRPRVYRTIARDILNEDPSYVSLGVGSGKLYLALLEEIRKRDSHTMLVGIVPKWENGFFNDENLYQEGGKLFYHEFDPQTIAKKLACPYTRFKSVILNSLEDAREGLHRLIEADNEDMIFAAEIASRRGMIGEASSSAGFLIEDQDLRREWGLKEDCHCVIVFTGRGDEKNWKDDPQLKGKIRVPFRIQQRIDKVIPMRVGTESIAPRLPSMHDTQEL